MWAVFIGKNRQRLKLTAEPKPLDLFRILNWLSKQVSPTWKMVLGLDKQAGTNMIGDILNGAELKESHIRKMQQLLGQVMDMVVIKQEEV